MNPEIKAQWVAALRSGEFLQGQGMLHVTGGGESDRFCCLGVLCVLAERAGAVTARRPVDTDVRDAVGYGDGSGHNRAYLPDEVTRWAGLDSGNPIIGRVGSSLATLNDNGTSFDRIADLIETNL